MEAVARRRRDVILNEAAFQWRQVDGEDDELTSIGHRYDQRLADVQPFLTLIIIIIIIDYFQAVGPMRPLFVSIDSSSRALVRRSVAKSLQKSRTIRCISS